jgi:DNA-binding transcriptional MerR regulator
MYISIGKAARMIGVSTSTLRIWDKKKCLRQITEQPGDIEGIVSIVY